MKLKYYLRGLGIGVAVSSLLMGYSGNKEVSEVSAKTVQEATQEDGQITSLRQTMKQQQQEIAEENMEQVTEVASETEVQTEEITAVPGIPEEEIESETSESSQSVSDAANAFVEKMEKEKNNVTEKIEETEVQEEMPLGEDVTITISKGEGSGTVSRKLETAGLIDNASEFDAYLMQHGYDKKITVGSHEVTTGASWMDIAKQLTK